MFGTTTMKAIADKKAYIYSDTTEMTASEFTIQTH